MEENAQPAMANRPLPTISVIVPCRNEAKHIGLCLESLLTSDFPKNQLEILVVDGMSDDGTRGIVDDYTSRYPCVKLIDNPAMNATAAMNAGVTAARGQVIAIVGAHAAYPPDYLLKCSDALTEYNVDNVGGVVRILPRSNTLVGKALAGVLSHQFGSGNAHYKVGVKRPRLVDTVFGGCYRREVFERVGLFNEKLPRGQDMEFNLRLQKAGGKTLLLPEIVCYYYARSDLKSFVKHNFQNGVWAILPFAFSDGMPVRIRHLVPLGFVSSLLGTAVLAFVAKPFLLLLLVIAIAYAVANLAASTQVAWRQGSPKFLLAMPWVFASLHVAYGLGSLYGVLKLIQTPGFWAKISGSKNTRREN
jgi:glycosyltransferase involved in cell wall biosynthesis